MKIFFLEKNVSKRKRTCRNQNKTFYSLGHYEEDDPVAPGQEEEVNLNRLTQFFRWQEFNGKYYDNPITKIGM